jgi:hypothetical protein
VTRKSPRIERCELCSRVVSEPDLDLTNVWKPGIAQPLRICNSHDCWEEAEAQGYRPQDDIAYESGAT